MGLEGVEQNIEKHDVFAADEAFMMGTPFSILTVTSLDCVPIGDGKVGKVTGLLLDAWSANVGVEIVRQIKAWGASGSGATSDVPSPYRFKRTR